MLRSSVSDSLAAAWLSSRPAIESETFRLHHAHHYFSVLSCTDFVEQADRWLSDYARDGGVLV